MIKPWIFEFLPELGGPSVEPDPPDVANLFARYLDLWVHDEALGFEGIFFSEHHFGRSYSPSPNLLIAALAGRTTKLRLGVMGVVLPYYHPAHAQSVAERLKSFVAEDERVSANVPDVPAPTGGFTLSDDEFITGTANDVARQIIEQCRTVGAGHFLSVLNWSAPFDEVAQAHELFGREAVPMLRAAS